MFILLKNENKNIVAGKKIDSSYRLEFEHMGKGIFGDDLVRLGPKYGLVPSEDRTLTGIIFRAIIPGLILGRIMGLIAPK